MAQSILKALFSAAARIGADPEDDDELRLAKKLLVTVALMVSTLAILWGLIYLAFREWIAASMPLAYMGFSVLSILVFSRVRNFNHFRTSQLLLILVVPFLLMVSLGGFINSGGVILWSLLCPFGALVFGGRRKAVRWFVLYLGLVLASGLLQDYVRINNNLTSEVVLLFFVMNISAVSLVAFVTFQHFVSERDTAFELLSLERAKSENLLLNILPGEIAEHLKKESGTIAQNYDDASILFADIVGFTPLSTSLNPVQTVELLNDVFSHFDSLVEKYDVEKIRTIGDNYMVASGVPRPTEDHAGSLANMALDMRSYIANYPTVAGHQLDMRIGINSGPVVAGVIGYKKFQYDVWGDAVNTASRMESQGEGGKIQVAYDTYQLLKNEFTFEPRGKLTVKGKGEMETWFLVSRNNGSQKPLTASL